MTTVTDPASGEAEETDYWYRSPASRVIQARRWLGLGDDADLFIRHVRAQELRSVTGGSQHTYAALVHHPRRGWAAAFLFGVRVSSEPWLVRFTDGHWKSSRARDRVLLDFQPTLLALLTTTASTKSLAGDAVEVSDIAGLLAFGDALLPLATDVVETTNAPGYDEVGEAAETGGGDAARAYDQNELPHQVALGLFALTHPQQAADVAAFARQPIATPLTILDARSKPPVT